MSDSHTPSPTVASPGALHVIVVLSNLKHAATLSPTVAFACRKLRVRSSIVALVSLLALTAFCSLHQHLNDVPHLTLHKSMGPAARPGSLRARAKTFRASLARPNITLSPDEELGAVMAFMAALPSNTLPDTVDPLVPIDPDLVLGFDTRTAKGAREVRHIVDDAWARLPVVLVTKRRSPIGREILALLDAYALHPPPAVFAVDERTDEAVLVPLLRRLTAAAELPILLVAGKPVGPLAALRELDGAGQLRAMLAASGAVVDGARKRGKGKRRLPS